MSWGKDPNIGTWKRGDNPGGMELGPLHLRELGLAAAVVTILSIVLWLDARANDAPQWRPERGVWPGWHILGVVLITLVCMLAVSGVIWLLHTALVSMARRSHEYRIQRERDVDETERRKVQNGTAHLAEALAAAHIPAEGALVRMTTAGWQVVNLGAERGAVIMADDGTVRRALHDELSVAQIVARFEVEREEARSRAFPALHTLQQRKDAGAAPAAEAVDQQVAAWPRVVRLHEIASDPVTVQRLALGVTVDASGRPMPVTAALGEMVHVAVGGAVVGASRSFSRRWRCSLPPRPRRSSWLWWTWRASRLQPLAGQSGCSGRLPRRPGRRCVSWPTCWKRWNGGGTCSTSSQGWTR